jgi:hypothetical protein
MHNKDLAILVFSCDAYNDLWDDFFDCFQHFWPDNKYNYYLVNNFKSYDRKGVNVLNAGSGDWSSRAKYALENVSSNYVLTFLDDYYIYEKVNSNEIDKVFNYVIANNVHYYQVDMTDKEDYVNWVSYNQKDFLYDIPKTRNYWVDTSVSIWDKNFLMQLLGNEDYSAWKFELDRNIDTKYPERYSDKICLFDCRSLITICMMVTQGKYHPKALVLIEEKYKKINVRNRRIMSTSEVWKSQSKRFFSKIRYGRKFAKFIGRKLGIVFVSDMYNNKK